MDKHSLMEKIAREAYEKGGFNGVWLYAEKGEIVSNGAIGFRDAENKLPMEVDTIFEMASVTKQFTAAAVMLLVREGKLSVDDLYTKYFPEYPYEGVTVRHLLTHTSGMPDDFETDTWVAPAWENEHRIPPCSEILRFIIESGEEASHKPGEVFRYTDIGYCLLANLVEKLSGIKFEDFLKERIFEPTGMDDTNILHTRRDGRPSDRIARNMVLEEDGFVPSDLSDAAGYVVGSDGLNGCDYAYTTVFDMLRWDRALREGKVLTLEEQAIMYTPVVLSNGEEYTDEDGEGYGFGWGVIRDEEHGLIVRHSGGMPGLNTWFERFIDEDRVLLFFINREAEDMRACGGFWDGMMAIARDEEPEPIVSLEDIMVKDPDKSNWESFCGKYEHPEDDDFTIEELYMKDGELYAKAIDDDGDDLDFMLCPIGENEFGRKGGFLKLTIGEGCITYSEHTFKKL
ncbi:MAG: beta-lactamase family protein [Clostridia bacterium]|nr:beta-lactamase family protein [Clostridia bacterium]